MFALPHKPVYGSSYVIQARDIKVQFPFLPHPAQQDQTLCATFSRREKDVLQFFSRCVHESP
jgi:hypothetical protein